MNAVDVARSLHVGDLTVYVEDDVVLAISVEEFGDPAELDARQCRDLAAWLAHWAERLEAQR
jgi:hypothetical protein